MKTKEYLHEMYNATSTADESGELETYQNWLERQLLLRINKEFTYKSNKQELLDFLTWHRFHHNTYDKMGSKDVVDLYLGNDDSLKIETK